MRTRYPEEYRFFGVTSVKSFWGLGWYKYRIKTYPHYQVLVLAFGPFRFHFKNLISRWRKIGQ